MEIDRSWGAVVVDNELRFLLVRHSNGQHWSHPKGHANPGETSFETAIREIREEGNVDVVLINGFQIRETWNLSNGCRKEVVYYLGRSIGVAKENRRQDAKTARPAAARQKKKDLPDGEEILERVWLSYHEALKRITYEAGRRVLRGAMEFLKNNGMGE